MQEILQFMTHEENHVESNCVLLAFVCHALYRGWILDCNHQRALTLDDVITELCNVPSLEGKPKIILIQECRQSVYIPFLIGIPYLSCTLERLISQKCLM